MKECKALTVFIGLVVLIMILGMMVIDGHTEILDRLTAIEQRMDNVIPNQAPD